MFLDHKGKSLNLLNKYKGHSVFMIGGGRSITPRHLQLLKEPGIISAALNQASHFIRPNIFYASDLHEVPESILIDPTIEKYVPTYVYDKPIYEHKDTTKLIGDFPNVTQCAVVTKSFNRSGFLDPRFLYRQRGPSEEYTPFSAIILVNLLLKLGFSKIYLVGYDFSSETNPCTYFYEREHVRGTGTGIAKIRNTMKQLLEIQDVVKIYNCSPRSGLDFFEYIDFEKAIDKNKIRIEADIYDKSTKDRFVWYIKNRTVAGGNTIFLNKRSTKK